MLGKAITYNLSPTLFNLYLNDLPNIFDNSCDPVHLESLENNLNCLLYADDLVIISTSKSGLQNAMNKLFCYSSEMQLSLNTDKTKILVFNKAGRFKKCSIKYNNKEIECVKRYTYLGICFAASGTYSYAKQELLNKGMKAYFKLCKSFANAHTLMHLFNHTIKPVIMYGSEVWGCFSNSRFKKDPNKMFHSEIDKLLIEKYTYQIL